MQRKYTLIEGLPKVGYATATFQDTFEQLMIPDSLSADIKGLLDSKGFIQVSPNEEIDDAEGDDINYVIKQDLTKRGGWNIIINGEKIDDKIFDEEMVDYVWTERVDLICDIQSWLCEARQAGRTSDTYLMDQDIDYLKTLNDNYVFRSMRTNEYVAYSDNPKRFREICQDILDTNKKPK